MCSSIEGEKGFKHHNVYGRIMYLREFIDFYASKKNSYILKETLENALLNVYLYAIIYTMLEIHNTICFWR